MEKEKRQLESKFDKLDKLSRALQQERIDLQATIKNLSKTAGNSASNVGESAVNNIQKNSSPTVAEPPVNNVQNNSSSTAAGEIIILYNLSCILFIFLSLAPSISDSIETPNSTESVNDENRTTTTDIDIDKTPLPTGSDNLYGNF